MKKMLVPWILLGALPVLAASALPAIQETETLPSMRLIPAGEFWMGRTVFFETDADGSLSRERRDDTPARKIHVDSFYIDAYEVTNADYARFVDATGAAKPWYWGAGKFPESEGRFPVHDVNWAEASAFCTWAGKRLPSEAEWERASRGGLEKKRFPWGDENPATGDVGSSNRRAHFGYPWGTIAVGSTVPNAYGIYDMAGNVWEWVQDWYARDYYTVSEQSNPRGPSSGEYRVIRGGGWSDTDRQTLMNHYRNYTNPETRAYTIGFRCARSFAATP